VRVRIGDADTFIPSGQHVYTITYQTNRQLGFFKDHDELYWNVTGNGWGFPIEKASATVTLPGDIPKAKIQLLAFTGPQGARGVAYRAGFDAGHPTFVTTAPLGPQEGLTIVVIFPKGVVTPPSSQQKLGYLLRDNLAVLVLGGGVLGLLLYFVLVWVKVGKDPLKGTVIPRFDTPRGMSPAAARYIRRMGYDNKVFAATVIDLAVKGKLTIAESGSEYTIARKGATSGSVRDRLYAMLQDGTPRMMPEVAGLLGLSEPALRTEIDQLVAAGAPLEVRQTMMRLNTAAQNRMPGGDTMPSSEESAVFDALLGSSSSFTFRQSHYQDVQAATRALQNDLGKRFENTLFVTNKGYFFVGVLLSVLAIGFAGYTLVKSIGPASIGKLMFVGMPLLFFVIMALPLWVAALTKPVNRIASFIGAIIITGFLSIFVVVGLTKIPGTIPLLPLVLIAAIVGLDTLFYHLLKAPTTDGRRILDEIEGFRLYLSVAESDRLNLQNPPEKTPELFEKFLPYALALDVEQEWSEKFSGVLALAGQGHDDYHPGWYSGRSWQHMGAAGFAAGLGTAMASAISSSSTAPGSSSGSGGSSGGGGGGGGGGGW